jgi:hypothetical protein
MKTSTVCNLAVMAIEAVLRLELPQVDAKQRRLMLRAGQRLMGVQLRAAEREKQGKVAMQAASDPEAFEALEMYSLNEKQLAHLDLGLDRNFDCHLERRGPFLWLIWMPEPAAGQLCNILIQPGMTVGQVWTWAKITSEAPNASTK